MTCQECVPAHINQQAWPGHPAGLGLGPGKQSGDTVLPPAVPVLPAAQRTPSAQGPGPALNLGRGGEEEMVSEASGMLSTLSSGGGLDLGAPPARSVPGAPDDATGLGLAILLGARS